MNKPLRLTNNMIKIINNSIINLPTPSNISIMWNFGSLIGMCLIIQILTGIFLAMHYSNNIEIAFSSIIHICREVNYGWIMRNIHANGASMFFICIFFHVGRGIYYNSFKFLQTWMIGVILLLITMATAFLGYVLPWGQMSFWGATVITNLFSAIPYLGENLVQWLWGGFSVNNATLTRFFTFHFILPFIIIALSMIHLMFLHQTGSSNPMGFNANYDKIPFHPFFTFKDMMGFILMLMLLNLLIIMNPNMLGDPDNFTPANPMNTPPHIKPEWYFLFAYAILRSIPNKLGGVMALFMSIIMLMFLPIYQPNKFKGFMFYPINQIMFWMFISIMILLTWIGASPVETPYILIGMILTILYFFYYLINPMLMNIWDKLI